MTVLRIFLIASILVSAQVASGWDSACFVGGVECEAGPEAARSRWVGGFHDEHRVLWEYTRIFAGLPRQVSDPFDLDVFTSSFTATVRGASVPTLQPTYPDLAAHKQVRTMTIGEFAQLPDWSFGLWDWVEGNEKCPLNGSPGAETLDAEQCHTFAGHMGAVNSNHFVPQAWYHYAYYHDVALNWADQCMQMQDGLGEQAERADFSAFLVDCERLALVLESIGQHFLHDAWAVGHMWERWGSPDLQRFLFPEDAIIVAGVSGLIHGARPLLEKLREKSPFPIETQFPDLLSAPLVSPESLVTLKGPLWLGDGATEAQIGVGDQYLRNLLRQPDSICVDLPFSEKCLPSTQYNQLFSCAVSGMLEVYARSGRQHDRFGTRGEVRPEFLPLVDSTSELCFGQRATNIAMAQGAGLDYCCDGLGKEVHMSLDQLAPLLNLYTSPLLATQIPVSATYLERRAPQLRADINVIAAKIAMRSDNAPGEVDLARGLPPLLLTERNSYYAVPFSPPDKTSRVPPSPYIDPPIGEVHVDTPAEAHRNSVIKLAFHRAHAAYWCDSGLLDLEELRERVLHGPAESSDAATAACIEFAARHLRVGIDAGSYDHTREPLCHFLAPNPSYVYQPGQASDSARDLAAEWCGGDPMPTPSVSPSPSETPTHTPIETRKPSPTYTWTPNQMSTPITPTVTPTSPQGDDRVILISVNRFGTDSGNGPSELPSISADGNLVAFASRATDLVEESPGQFNLGDVFVRDVGRGVTTLVSVNGSGTAGGNAPSTIPFINADGRFVAFTSYATDLAGGIDPEHAKPNAYVRDLVGQQTVRMRIEDSLPGYTGAGSLGISPDGNRVFIVASRVRTSDFQFESAVFVGDSQSGTTELVTPNQSGTCCPDNAIQVFSQQRRVMSDDGNFVVIESRANNLVPNDNNYANSYSDIFLRDVEAGTTTLLSATHYGAGPGTPTPTPSSGTYGARCGSISADGKVVAFESASNLAPPFDNGSAGALLNTDFYVYTRADESLRRIDVSLHYLGYGSAGCPVGCPQLTADGQFLLFSNCLELVLQNLETGERTVVNRKNSGTGTGTEDPRNPLRSFLPKPLGISTDGNIVAFASTAADLVTAPDTMGMMNVFLSDVSAGKTTLALGTLDGILSADGKSIVLASSGKLVANDHNGMPEDDLVFFSDVFLFNGNNAPLPTAPTATPTQTPSARSQ